MISTEIPEPTKLKYAMSLPPRQLYRNYAWCLTREYCLPRTHFIKWFLELISSWAADSCSASLGILCSRGNYLVHFVIHKVQYLAHSLSYFNPLTPNDLYMSRTAPLTSKRWILYIYSTNVGTEYFKHALYSPFFSLQNAVCFIMLTSFVPALFTFYIQGLLK